MIRPATAVEAPHLSELAFRSKALWGYSDAFMQACREELTITPDDDAYVLEMDRVVVGFYSLEPLADGRLDLAHLFVDPPHVRRGYGRHLLHHAIERARAMGHHTLLIVSDPHAAPFYEAAGATLVGTSPSQSIPGRLLPTFEVALAPS